MNPTQSSPGHVALRRHRYSIPNRCYFVTIVCYGRKNLFSDHQNARVIARTIHKTTLWGDSRLLAWVLMPDHFHGLLQLGQTHDLSRVIQRVKSVTTKNLRACRPALTKLWQAAYYDHCLRHEEDIESVVRYLLNNPLRAGLVSDLGSYSYWNVDWDITIDWVI